MAWFYLSIAILLEISGTTFMKLSDGFTRMGPTMAMVVSYGAAFGLLTLAIRRIDVGVAYAIWSGVGTAMIATIGFVYFKETVTLLKIGGILLIILGVVALKVGDTTTP